MVPAKSLTRASLALASALALCACESVPQEWTEPLPHPTLDSQALPADVAVAPIRNLSGQAGLPAELLRGAFYEGLVERLYSPLALSFVDQVGWTEAGFQSEDPTIGVLQVLVTSWDTDLLESHGALSAAAEVRLFPGPEARGEPSWGLSIKRRIDVGHLERSQRLERGATLFAAEVLALLPERDPLRQSAP